MNSIYRPSASSSSAAAVKNVQRICRRWMGSGGGTRGARGRGWLINYRAGKGGRHLQGEYAHLDLDVLRAWNDAVMSLGSTQAYIDVRLEDVGSDQQTKTTDAAADDVEETTTADDNTAESAPLNKHRLTFELATAVLPLATQNFMKLLEAEPGIGYNGSALHRVEKKVGISGGLVWNPSLFPDDKEENNVPPKRRGYKVIGRCHPSLTMPTSATNMDVSSEKLVLSHLPGVITMLSPRVHEIDSRFMLCSRHAPHLDGQTVAIGRLSKESLEKVQEWESTLITSYGTPTNVTLRIVGCGILGEEITTAAVTADSSRSTNDSDMMSSSESTSAESGEGKKKVTEP